jgi:hypothetical protein
MFVCRSVLCVLGISLLLAVLAGGAAARPAAACTASADGSSWTVTLLNVPCSFVKSVLPGLVTEKTFAPESHVAKIKPPQGFKVCVVVVNNDKKFKSIQCSKKGSLFIAGRV